jgi:hypothetical protein
MTSPLENSPLRRDPYTDPNLALRNFNAYFGKLRKDYGEDAIRAAGITPRVLAEIQATLRKVQMDPRATPEQHRQADRDANAMLVQKMTSPLTRPASATQTVAASELDALERANKAAQVVAANPFAVTPEVEVRRVMPTPVMPETPPMPVPSASDYIANMVRPPKPVKPSMAQPDVKPLEEVGPDGQRTVTINGLKYHMPRMGIEGGAPPTPSASDYVSNMIGNGAPPVALPGGTGYDDRGNMLKSSQPTLGDMMKGGIGSMLPPMQSTPMQPTAPGILPGIMPQQPAAPSMNTQPGADFDRNVARQIFDSEFRTLREKYGDEGLRSAGLTPRTLSALQAPLTNVQRDNTISYDQSSAALEDALQKLRGYNFGGAQPAAPMQPAAPAPIMGGTLGGTLGGMMADVPPPMSSTPQAPNPITQGMALGGLINKYYR